MEDRSVWLQSHVIMLGLLELMAISLLHFFVFLTNCFHVVPMCLMTWAKVIQVRSSVLGVASSLSLLSPVIVSYSCAKTDNFVFSGLVRKTKLRSF